MNSQNYAFASGKIRYLETKLPDETDLERMIGAPDLETAFKAFYDTDYADNLLETRPDEFEKVIFSDLKQNKELLFKIIPDNDFIKFLLLEYDFHNLKIIFKERLFKKDLDYLLLPLGFFEPADLKKIILSGEKIPSRMDLSPRLTNLGFKTESEKIDKEIQEIIDEAKAILDEKTELHKIEFFFDRKYFWFFKKIAEKLKNKFLIGFVNLRINLTNLRIFLRLKNLGKDVEFLKEALIDFGNLKPNDFISFYHQDPETALKFFSKIFPSQFAKYFAEYLKEQKLWLLEKRLFEEEIEYLRKAKYIAFGPELVAAYFYAKRNANKNVRLIMNGKLNKIEQEILRKRLRKLY